MDFRNLLLAACAFRRLSVAISGLANENDAIAILACQKNPEDGN